MIAFRKRHPSFSRSRFWREDVTWYGVSERVDLSNNSHSLAFCLHGASQDDDDIYVMINAYWEELEFQIREATVQEWMRIVDTALASPYAIPHSWRTSAKPELFRGSEIGCGSTSNEK